MHSYYQIVCFTNIDAMKGEEWPKFSEGMRPSVGDLVRSASGKTLRVVAITYSEKINEERDYRTSIVEIELHHQL
jgi:hypothetical protein